MLKQSLSQRLLQKLSPQQIQFIKLLQIPTSMLEQRIKEELEENPALEEGMQDEKPEVEDEERNTEEEKEDEYDDNPAEDVEIKEYLEDDDIPDYKLADNNYREEDEDAGVHSRVAVRSSFIEQLNNQLELLDLSEREYTIAEQIIGSLDEDGYLRRKPINIADDLAFSLNLICEPEEVEEVLTEVIQGFDPAGIGARDLQECLLLQLNRKHHSPSALTAQIIIEKYFEEYSMKHFDKIRKSLNLSEAQLKAAHEEIIHLNPKPGGSSAGSEDTNRAVIPDFILHNEEGRLDLRLNARNAPELRISREYREMLRHYNQGGKPNPKTRETLTFVKQKLDSAKWFIDAIRQRQHTLLSTMEAILEHQRLYFLSGDTTQLKPMILKDIADKVSLDISTVSRVANSKYIQTEFGTFLLKSFFSEGIMTDSGEEASSKEVKAILSELIRDENKRKPLSDDRLSEILNERGYNIARRTVAKYREALNLPVARLRKEI